MRNIFSVITILVISTGILSLVIVNPVSAQALTLEQIKTNLLNNPPNTGDPTVREGTILALDDILKNDSARYSQGVRNFYNFMMEKVNQELSNNVLSGAVIWMMYNHGFIVKTPQNVFAFDLVDGYYNWPIDLPPELISQVKVLFISHSHSDHYDNSVATAVMANGGYVVVPSENSNLGNVSMAPGDSLIILGLRIKAYEGLHSVPVRIFEVKTSNGFKFIHTGDNQTSTTLPVADSVDVLLLNAWVNESGLTSAVAGMRNCLNRLIPAVMIPGHIQELGHDYNPSNPASRVPYEWAFAVDDVPLNSQVQVMAWGERYFVSDLSVGITDHSESTAAPGSFVLHQNHPNPFNPITHIRFGLPRTSTVKIEVFNILGEKVVTLLDAHKPAGYHTIDFDGSSLASGIYLYRMHAADYINVKKMVLMK